MIAARLEACLDVFSFELGDDIKSVTKVKEALTKERAVALLDATKKVMLDIHWHQHYLNSGKTQRSRSESKAIRSCCYIQDQ